LYTILITFVSRFLLFTSFIVIINTYYLYELMGFTVTFPK
jgi:hypothetical protein